MSMAQCWLDCDHFVWFFSLYFGSLCFMRLLYLLPTLQNFISFWMDTPLHNNALFQCWIKFILYIQIIRHCLKAISYNGVSLNKANLRDLIAATGLVILLKFDPNHRFFVPCDLEIWWMALENNRAPLLYYIKLCASFQIHQWIQIGITVRKRSIWVKIGNFLSRVTLKFDRWHRKTIEHLFYVASSFVYHFTAISEFKLELQSGNAQFWSKSMIFLAVWPWNLMDDLQKQ